MESIKEIKDRILSSVRFEVYPPIQLGGQSCGMPIRGCKLISDDVDFEICIHYFRSQLKNKEMALDLFELYLDEVIK